MNTHHTLTNHTLYSQVHQHFLSDPAWISDLQNILIRSVKIEVINNQNKKKDQLPATISKKNV
jgi:hypothetical protein